MSQTVRSDPSMKRVKAKVVRSVPQIHPDREAKRHTQSLALLYLAPVQPCYLHATTERWDCISLAFSM